MANNNHGVFSRLHRGDDLLWRWQVVNAHGQVIANARSGCLRRVDCTTEMHRVGMALLLPDWQQP